MRALLERVGIRVPIFQAPMAGGTDTPALAAQVGAAGGLGSLGCGYLQPAQIESAVAAYRALSDRPLGVNLFVRASHTIDEAARDRVTPLLDELRRELGLSIAPPSPRIAPSYPEQLDAVLRLRPRVFSFTFGLPTAAQIAALHAADVFVIGTATSLDEGEALVALGVDAVCAQGSEAGGHRGTFLGRAEDSLIGTMALVRQLVARLPTPIIAAGGVMDGAGIRAALALGASAVQLGTAFLLCPEAGTHPAHREALRSPAARHTVITRAFSGRAARGIANRFTARFENVACPPFPQQQDLTADLRAAAAAAGRVDLMQLWAGQGAPLLRELPVAELMRVLLEEAGC